MSGKIPCSPTQLTVFDKPSFRALQDDHHIKNAELIAFAGGFGQCAGNRCAMRRRDMGG
jgi:hypothetical protein